MTYFNALLIALCIFYFSFPKTEGEINCDDEKKWVIALSEFSQNKQSIVESCSELTNKHNQQFNNPSIMNQASKHRVKNRSITNNYKVSLIT